MAATAEEVKLVTLSAVSLPDGPVLHDGLQLYADQDGDFCHIQNNLLVPCNHSRSDVQAQDEAAPAPVMPNNQTSKVKSSWSREATLALLALYAERKQKFDGPRYKNKVLWAEISTLLKEKGYMYDTEQAEGRWKTLLAAYRRTNDHNNKSGNDRKDMPFFQEVEDIVGDNPTVSPFAVISSSHGLTHRQKQTATKRKLKGSFQTADKGEDDDKASSDGSASTASTVKKQPCPNKKVKKEEELVNVLVKAQAERMKLAEKVHGDHMVVLNGVLDVLKQVVSRNQPY